MAVYTETVQLKDEVSGPAKNAAGSVNALSGKILDVKNVIDIGKNTITAAMGSIKQSFTALAAGDVKGAVEGITEAFAGMAQLLDFVVPGLGQAASAVIKVAGGLAGLAAGIIKDGMAMAIEAATGKQAMLSYFDAMGQGIVTGEETEAMIDGLKNKIGIAKDSLVGWTKELQAMGMVDLAEIEKNLQATASASALMGKEGEAAFMKMTAKIQNAAMTGEKLKLADKQFMALAKTGVNIADVAAKMGMKVEDLRKELSSGGVDAAKFGDAMQNALIEKGAGPLQKLASSLPNLKKLLEESIGDMFEDIDVGPFLEQVKSLFEIFGQGKPSGQAMKAGIQGAFQSIFDTATKVVPYVKHFLLDLVIYGLKAYIGLKPIIKWFKELSENQTVISIVSSAFSYMKDMIVGVAIAVGIAIGVVAGLIAVIVAINVALAAAVAAIVSFGAEVINTFVNLVSQAITMGSQFVDGLVQGITNGAIKVVDAVKNLANSAKDTFKNALGIASPSKIGMQMGGFFGQGVAQGVEDEVSTVSSASGNLAGAAVSGGAGGAASAGASSGGVQVTVEAGAIVIQGAGKSATEITEEMISVVFERIALQQGL